MKYKSHVGLNYNHPNVHLFGFQLLAEDNLAHAIVDFTDGSIDRVLVTPSLEGRKKAIIRLASIHERKSQPSDLFLNKITESKEVSIVSVP